MYIIRRMTEVESEDQISTSPGRARGGPSERLVAGQKLPTVTILHLQIAPWKQGARVAPPQTWSFLGLGCWTPRIDSCGISAPVP